MKQVTLDARIGLVCLLAVAGACGQDRTRGDDSQGSTERTSRATSADSGTLGAGWVYTADEGGASITRVDLRTGRTHALAVGVMPHNVQVAPDGRTLLAVGSPGTAAGEHEDEPAGGAGRGFLIALPADAANSTGMFRVPLGRMPAHVVPSRDGRRAFTTNSGDDAVLVVDLAARRVVDTIRTCAFPHGLRLSPDGRELYVACVNASAVAVIDAEHGREVTRIPVGRAPVQVGFLPDGKRVYVSLRDANAVGVIDTRARRMTRTIPVGHSPIQLMATPDGRLVFVANQGTAASPDSTVSVIATDADSVVATLPSGRGAHGVAVSTDGTRAFVTNTFANSMTVIDAKALRPVRTITVGREPGGISYRR